MKVDEKAHGITAESQVRQQLCVVNWKQFGNCFQFYDDLVLDQQVDSISNVDGNAFIEDWHGKFRLDGNIPESEVLNEALSVRALEQAGTHGRVHPDGGLNDLAR